MVTCSDIVTACGSGEGMAVRGEAAKCIWPAEDKSSEETLSKGTIRGKMGIIVKKEVLETTATQTVGGPELSSRGSVAIYTTWKLVLCCVGECLSPYQYSLSSPLRPLLFVLKYCLVYIEDCSSVISCSAVVFQSPAGGNQQSSAACTGVAPFAATEALALSK